MVETKEGWREARRERFSRQVLETQITWSMSLRVIWRICRWVGGWVWVWV
jgi:hypothetical protein